MSPRSTTRVSTLSCRSRAAYCPRWCSGTNAILQGYVSRSVYGRAETDLSELRGTKTQLSAGIHHRRGAHLLSVALTENIGNINNTPDFGMQVGYSFNPGWN